MQKDRIEVSLVGFARDYECYVIDHRIFWGDPNAAQVWNDLDDFLKKRFQTESGRIMPISCTCIDSGGHHTNQVYQFTKPRQARRVFAIKGLSVAGKPIANKPTFVGKNRAVLYGVGTDQAKELIYGRLAVEPDKATLHFAADLDEEYFKQLTAEKRITTFTRGKKQMVWKQIRPRNETLDCLVYSFAAIYILNPNWDSIETKILNQSADPVKNNQSQRNNANIRPGRNFVNSWKDL